MTRDSLRILVGAAGLAALLVAVLILAVADNHQLHESARLGHLGGLTATPAVENAAPTSSGTPPAAAGSSTPPTAPPASAELSQGGDAQRGRTIFFENPQVNCSKCHAIRGQGGNIGPDLSEIGSKRTREELLQSLLNPDQVISDGFQTLMVATIDGRTLFGVVREDSGQQVRLVDVEGREHTIPVDDIDERRPGRSAMPADISTYLSPAQIRDLVEFLGSCR